jgi:hypothetical protein
MIRVVHPGSESLLFTHPGSRIQGSKTAPDPGSGSATLLSNWYPVPILPYSVKFFFEDPDPDKALLFLFKKFPKIPSLLTRPPFSISNFCTERILKRLKKVVLAALVLKTLKS